MLEPTYLDSHHLPQKADGMKFLIATLILFSISAKALSINRVEGTQGELAAHHYQPFTGLKVYAAAGWLTCYLMSQEWRESGTQRDPVYSGVDIGAIPGVGGLLVMALTAGPVYSNEPEKPFAIDQIDLKEYERMRTNFYFTYGVLAASEVIMATSSGATNKWWGLAVGIAGPFALDQIFRPLFYRDRLSPFAHPTVTVDAKGTPVVGLAATF